MSKCRQGKNCQHNSVAGSIPAPFNKDYTHHYQQPIDWNGMAGINDCLPWRAEIPLFPNHHFRNICQLRPQKHNKDRNIREQATTDCSDIKRPVANPRTGKQRAGDENMSLGVHRYWYHREIKCNRLKPPAVSTLRTNQVLNLNSIISPSLTRYSLPSSRALPASLAAVSPPSST